MVPNWRLYLLALTPVGISAVQLLMRYNTSDKDAAMLADIICITLISISLVRFRIRYPLAVFTVLCIFQAILTAGFYEGNTLRFVHHCLVYIIFPYFLASAYARYESSVLVRMGLIAALGLAAMNIVVMPVELMMRGGGAHIHELNFSGRAYELIAVLLLAGTLTAIDVHRINTMLSISLLITAILSFSRGALIVSLSILLLGSGRKIFQLFSIKNIIILLFLIFGMLELLPGDFLESFSSFWITRLNYIEDDSVISNIDGFLEGGGREDILSMGFNHVEEWPYLGTGIATTSYFIGDVTNGTLAFSGYHNLTLTVIAERGIILGSIFVIGIIFLFIKLVVIRKLTALVNYVGFLFFSHTTGAEFVLHSDYARNANILFFLFLIFMRLTQMKRTRDVQTIT